MFELLLGKSFIAFIKKFACAVLPSLIFLCVLSIRPILRLLERDEFYFGGTSGFWGSTVLSLLKANLYDQPYGQNWMMPVFTALIALSILTAAGIIYTQWRPSKSAGVIDMSLTGMTAFLLTCAGVIVLQHHILGTKYVIARTACFFIPAFSLFLIFLWQSLRHGKNKIASLITNGIMTCLTVAVIGHFALSANLTYFHGSRLTADTNKMMRDLKQMNQDKRLPNSSITMGTFFHLSAPVNFYKLGYRLNWLDPVGKYTLDKPHDYYYLIYEPDESDASASLRAYYKESKRIIEKYNLKIIKTYPFSRTVLAVPN